MRDRLDQRETLLVESERLARPEQLGRLPGRLSAVGQRGGRVVEPLDDGGRRSPRRGRRRRRSRARGREDDVGRHAGEPAERLQVAAERIDRSVGPPAHVGRDLVQQHVAAEQSAAAKPEQRDVAVGMAGQVQHPVRLARPGRPRHPPPPAASVRPGGRRCGSRRSPTRQPCRRACRGPTGSARTRRRRPRSRPRQPGAGRAGPGRPRRRRSARPARRWRRCGLGGSG